MQSHFRPQRGLQWQSGNIPVLAEKKGNGNNNCKRGTILLIPEAVCVQTAPKAHNAHQQHTCQVSTAILCSRLAQMFVSSYIQTAITLTMCSLANASMLAMLIWVHHTC